MRYLAVMNVQSIAQVRFVAQRASPTFISDGKNKRQGDVVERERRRSSNTPWHVRDAVVDNSIDDVGGR